MEKSGIFREIDRLGRIVIPMEMRKTLDIRDGDSLEILVNGATIVLKKKHESCSFCGNVDGLNEFGGKFICPNCIAKIKQLY